MLVSLIWRAWPLNSLQHRKRFDDYGLDTLNLLTTAIFHMHASDAERFMSFNKFVFTTCGISFINGRCI